MIPVAVLLAVDDASQRIVAGLEDATARARLGPALAALRADLAANHRSRALMRLAQIYDLLDELERGEPGAGMRPDAPEFAAIRLSLVPAVEVLGVAGK